MFYFQSFTYDSNGRKMVRYTTSKQANFINLIRFIRIRMIQKSRRCELGSYRKSCKFIFQIHRRVGMNHTISHMKFCEHWMKNDQVIVFTSSGSIQQGCRSLYPYLNFRPKKAQPYVRFKTYRAVYISPLTAGVTWGIVSDTITSAYRVEFQTWATTIHVAGGIQVTKRCFSVVRCGYSSHSWSIDFK